MKCTIFAAALFAAAVAPLAHAADKGCSNASLVGTYAFTSSGAITAPPEIAGPFAEIGMQVFDGNGGTTATATLSANGNVIPVTVTGTYTVNADCTGTFTIQVSPINTTVHVTFVLAADLTEFHAIETDPGLVITRIGRKLYPGRAI